MIYLQELEATDQVVLVGCNAVQAYITFLVCLRQVRCIPNYQDFDGNMLIVSLSAHLYSQALTYHLYERFRISCTKSKHPRVPDCRKKNRHYFHRGNISALAFLLPFLADCRSCQSPNLAHLNLNPNTSCTPARKTSFLSLSIDYYSSLFSHFFGRLFCCRIRLRRRSDLGVTSTTSSSAINSMACSRFNAR